MPGNVAVDTISEVTAAAGVTIDGALIKDGATSAMSIVTNISGDGAITIAAGIVTMSKGSAAAITLAAPSAAQEGTVITITSRSAYAHVVTATSLVEDGITGGAKTTCTFGAFVGASLTLVAINLKWHVVSKNVCTIT